MAGEIVNSELPDSVWVVFDAYGADFVAEERQGAMDHALESADHAPQFAPYEVQEYTGPVEVAKLRDAVELMMKTLEDFMPNVGRCVLQDYARLNEALMAGEANRRLLRELQRGKQS